MHVHTEACQWTIKNGRRRCKTARNEADPRKAPMPDGWEDEFGPAPRRVMEKDWYDEVVVLRLLNRIPVGRRPTQLEWEAFFTRNRFVTAQEAARVSGLNSDYLGPLAKKFGYVWPGTNPEGAKA